MPSEDPINPAANRWWYRDAEGQIHEIEGEAEHEVPARPAEQAARVQQLAYRLGLDAETLAGKIPDDTLRRLKFPAIEQPQDDGTTAFKHDLGISQGVAPLLGTDRAHDPIPPGSAPRPRGADGKFSK